MKNGIFVPSFEVASCCSTTRPPASNIAGSRLTSATLPFSAVTNNVVGWMKLVKVKKYPFEYADVATTPTVPRSGAGTLSKVQRPP